MHPGYFLCLLVICLVTTQPAWSEGIDDALSAIRQKDYASAVQILTSEAEKGDAEAQFRLASLYRGGLGVEKNLQQAFEWMDKAAQQGHAKAEYNLGEFYYHGWGVARDREKANHWYEKAAENDYPLARKKLDRIKTNPTADYLATEGESGITALFAASRKGDQLKVKALLDQDIPVDSTNSSGQTPLMIALSRGHADTATLLLKHNAKISATDSKGGFPCYMQ